jgi:hypothetical protein
VAFLIAHLCLISSLEPKTSELEPEPHPRCGSGCIKMMRLRFRNTVYIKVTTKLLLYTHEPRPTSVFYYYGDCRSRQRFSSLHIFPTPFLTNILRTPCTEVQVEQQLYPLQLFISMILTDILYCTCNTEDK